MKCTVFCFLLKSDLIYDFMLQIQNSCFLPQEGVSALNKTISFFLSFLQYLLCKQYYVTQGIFSPQCLIITELLWGNIRITEDRMLPPCCLMTFPAALISIFVCFLIQTSLSTRCQSQNSRFPFRQSNELNKNSTQEQMSQTETENGSQAQCGGWSAWFIAFILTDFRRFTPQTFEPAVAETFSEALLLPELWRESDQLLQLSQPHVEQPTSSDERVSLTCFLLDSCALSKADLLICGGRGIHVWIKLTKRFRQTEARTSSS